MATKPRILITSAAGKTGLPTALQLLAKGYPVRAFVRREDQRSIKLKLAGAEVFIADQYSLNDMRRAMRGIDRAYQCAPTAPNGLHFNAVFTVAAAEAGIGHVVTLSQWLAGAEHPSLFTREVYLADQLARLRSGTTVTTVNPGWFADNYLMVLDLAAHLGVFAMPLGDGDRKTNAPPASEDIASVAVAALIDPDRHAGETYRPTGPALMSPNEIADAMGRALGRRVRYVEISERMMVKALKALPPSNYSEAAVTQLAIYAEEYRRGTFAVNAPTDHVERVAGHVPRSFEGIVRRTLEGRPELSRSIGRSLSAMGSFLKILTTRPFNLTRAEIHRDYVRLAKPAFAQDNAAWREGHFPQAQRSISSRAA